MLAPRMGATDHRRWAAKAYHYLVSSNKESISLPPCFLPGLLLFPFPSRSTPLKQFVSFLPNQGIFP